MLTITKLSLIFMKHSYSAIKVPSVAILRLNFRMIGRYLMMQKKLIVVALTAAFALPLSTLADSGASQVTVGYVHSLSKNFGVSTV